MAKPYPNSRLLCPLLQLAVSTREASALREALAFSEEAAAAAAREVRLPLLRLPGHRSPTHPYPSDCIYNYCVPERTVGLWVAPTLKRYALRLPRRCSYTHPCPWFFQASEVAAAALRHPGQARRGGGLAAAEREGYERRLADAVAEVKHRSKTHRCSTDLELAKWRASLGGAKLTLQRFNGLA